MLMLKARHGWSNTSFKDLLRILADTYPEGNKVPANTNRAKKLIRPVAMKLKKFHAWLGCYIWEPRGCQLMSWHASDEHTKDDGKLRHPSDGKQWKHFNTKF